MICFSPNWEVRFSILELSWVVLSFLYHWSDFALNSHATTKEGLLSKILSDINSKLPVNVSKSSFIDLIIVTALRFYKSFIQFLIQKQYIYSDNEYQVLSKEINFYSTHRHRVCTCFCFWQTSNVEVVVNTMTYAIKSDFSTKLWVAMLFKLRNIV